MLEGVQGSRAFVLFLSASVLTRHFCQKEIRKALLLGKPVVLVAETDSRHGGPVQLPRLPAVRCSEPGCAQPAQFASALAASAVAGSGGPAWPTHCAKHKPLDSQKARRGKQTPFFACGRERLREEWVTGAHARCHHALI